MRLWPETHETVKIPFFICSFFFLYLKLFIQIIQGFRQNLEQQKFQSKNPFNYYNYRLKEDDLTIAIQTTQNIIHSQKLFDIKRLGKWWPSCYKINQKCWSKEKWLPWIYDCILCNAYPIDENVSLMARITRYNNKRMLIFLTYQDHFAYLTGL